MDSIINLDISLFRLINSWSGNGFIDIIMLTLTSRNLWIIVAVGLIAFCIRKKSKKGLRVICALVVCVGLTDALCFEVLKPAFQRPRPCHGLADVNLVQHSCGSEFGFPSNHAANGMATLVAQMLAIPHVGATMLVFSWRM